MADAELVLKATLDDQASAPLDDLDQKVKKSAKATADANRTISNSADQSARNTGRSASAIARAYQGTANTVKAAVGQMRSGITSSAQGIRNYVGSFKSVQAASSTVTGALRNVSTTASRAFGPGITAARNFGSNLRNTAGGAVSAFNRQVGTISGAVSQTMGRAANGFGSFVKSTNAAADRAASGFKSKFLSKIGDLKSEVADKMKNVGVLAGAALGGAIIAQAAVSVKNASDLEQSMGAVDAVFKQNSQQIKNWSVQAAGNVGLTTVQYQTLATVLGSSLKNGGMALDEVAGKTNDLITVGADLSSMFGGTTQEAVEAMTSALRGETDPIERYGVSLSAAKVEAEALAMGAKKVNNELPQQAKQAAILSLIQKQTADSTGNFARETDTFAGGVAVLTATWSNFTTQLASYVLPFFTVFIGFLQKNVLPALDGITNGWGAFWTALRSGSEADWGVLTGLELAAFNAGVTIHDLVTTVGPQIWEFAKGVFGALSPLGPALAGFAAGMGEGFTQLGYTLGSALSTLLPALIPVINGFAKFLAVVLELVGPTLPVLIPLIGGAFIAFKAFGMVTGILSGISGAFKLILGLIRLIPAALTAIPVIGWVMLVISGLILMYQKVGWFRDAVNAAWDWIKMAAAAAVDGIIAAWNWAGETLALVWQALQNGVGGIVNAWNWLRDTATNVWTAIITAAQVAIEWFVSVMKPVWDAIVLALGYAFEGLKLVVETVWGAIRMSVAVAVGVLMTLWQGIVWFVQNILAPVFTWFYTTVIQPVWTAISNTISTVWGFIRDAILNPMILFVRTALTFAWQWIRSVVTQVWTAISNTISTVWAFIRDAILNPLITFLRTTLTFAWQWIKNTVAQVWSAIRTSISTAWTFIRDVILNPLITFLRTSLTFAWQWIRNVVAQVWGAIRGAIGSAWTWIRDVIFFPIINFLRGPLTSAWNWMRNLISQVWSSIRGTIWNAWQAIKSNTFDPLTNFVRNTIPGAFRAARDGIKNAWDAIRGVVKAPVEFFVNTVYNNGLRANVNKVLDKVGLSSKHLPEMKLPPGFFKVGGYTGAGNPNDPAGIVHRDEQVIKSTSRRSIERERPGYLDQLNDYGARALAPEPQHTNPGHMMVGASVYGGRGSFTNPLQRAIARTGVLNVAGSAPGWGLGGAIRMADEATGVKVRAGRGGSNTVNVSSGRLADWWAGYYQDNWIKLNENAIQGERGRRIVAAHEIGHSLGLPHSDPSGIQSIMSYANMYQHGTYTAADVAALSAIYGGSGKAGVNPALGDADLLSVLFEPLKALLDKVVGGVTSKFQGNVFGDLIGGVGGILKSGVFDWALEQAAKFGNFVDDMIEGGKKIFNGVASRTKVTAWMTEALTKAHEFNPLNLASGVNRAFKESGGDPNAQNNTDINAQRGDPSKGLMQVIGTTFKANMWPGHGNIWDPVDNILASINYTKRTYGSLRAGWDRPGGYARGTVLPGYRPGYDTIPSLLSAGEAVLNPQLTAALGPANINAANLHASGNRAGGSGNAVGLLTRPTTSTRASGDVTVTIPIAVYGNPDADTITEISDRLRAEIEAIFEDMNRREY